MSAAGPLVSFPALEARSRSPLARGSGLRAIPRPPAAAGAADDDSPFLSRSLERRASFGSRHAPSSPLRRFRAASSSLPVSPLRPPAPASPPASPPREPAADAADAAAAAAAAAALLEEVSLARSAPSSASPPDPPALLDGLSEDAVPAARVFDDYLDWSPRQQQEHLTELLDDVKRREAQARARVDAANERRAAAKAEVEQQRRALTRHEGLIKTRVTETAAAERAQRLALDTLARDVADLKSALSSQRALSEATTSGGIDLFAGYLSKRATGFLSCRWNQRFFMLRDDELLYYHSEERDSPPKRVPLEDVTGCEELAALGDAPEFPFGFVVHTRGLGDLVLGCASVDDGERWIAELTRLCRDSLDAAAPASAPRPAPRPASPPAPAAPAAAEKPQPRSPDSPPSMPDLGGTDAGPRRRSSSAASLASLSSDEGERKAQDDDDDDDDAEPGPFDEHDPKSAEHLRTMLSETRARRDAAEAAVMAFVQIRERLREAQWELRKLLTALVAEEEQAARCVAQGPFVSVENPEGRLSPPNADLFTPVLYRERVPRRRRSSSGEILEPGEAEDSQGEEEEADDDDDDALSVVTDWSSSVASATRSPAVPVVAAEPRSWQDRVSGAPASSWSPRAALPLGGSAAVQPMSFPAAPQLAPAGDAVRPSRKRRTVDIAREAKTHAEAAAVAAAGVSNSAILKEQAHQVWTDLARFWGATAEQCEANDALQHLVALREATRERLIASQREDDSAVARLTQQCEQDEFFALEL